MYRSLSAVLTATVFMLAAATTAAAQRGGFHGGSIMGSAAVSRPAPAVGFAPAVRPGPVARPVPGSAFGARPVHPGIGIAPFGFAHRQRSAVVAPIFGFYSPFYSPYAWSPYYGGPEYYPGGPGYYPYPGYPDSGYVPSAAAPSGNQGEVDLAYQVGRLSEEINQLRQQQAAVPYAQQITPQSAQEREGTPTALVFRDGRRMEVQNYAIVGQAVWVLDEKASTRILLSDLDIDATLRENRARGLRFAVPGK